jgi:palmitoyl-protein thioesterase
VCVWREGAESRGLYPVDLSVFKSLLNVDVLPSGGLVCRALLSVMDEHNVDTFISLSSPQMGQYGGEWALWDP